MFISTCVVHQQSPTMAEDAVYCAAEASFYFSVFFLNPADRLDVTSNNSLSWSLHHFIAVITGEPTVRRTLISLSELQYQMLPSCETATTTLEADHHMASNWSIKELSFQVATVLELSGSNNPGFQYWDHKIKIWVYIDKSTVET